MSPAEKHREFERENGKWHDRVEEVLSELDELAREADERLEPETPAEV
jgi:regulator of sirC expression with transglutaminase-like and TPR domain